MLSAQRLALLIQDSSKKLNSLDLCRDRLNHPAKVRCKLEIQKQFQLKTSNEIETILSHRYEFDPLRFDILDISLTERAADLPSLFDQLNRLINIDPCENVKIFRVVKWSIPSRSGHQWSKSQDVENLLKRLLLIRIESTVKLFDSGLSQR